MHQFISTLKRVPLFHDLSDTELNEIAPFFQRTKIRRNHDVLTIHQDGARLYILKYGQVKIIVPGEDGNSEQVLATLGPGSYFGEMSLLTGEPVSATVRTSLESEFLQLERDDFIALLKKYSKLSFSISMILSKRLRERNVSRIMQDLPESVSIFAHENDTISARLSCLLGLFLHYEGMGRVLIIDFHNINEIVIEQLGFFAANEKLDSFIRTHDIGENLQGVTGRLYQYDISRHSHERAFKQKTLRSKVEIRGVQEEYHYTSGLYWLKLQEKDRSLSISADHVSPLLGLVSQIYDVVILDLGSCMTESVEKALSQANKNIFVSQRAASSLTKLSQTLESMSSMQIGRISNFSFVMFKTDEDAGKSISGSDLNQYFQNVAFSTTNMPVSYAWFDEKLNDTTEFLPNTPVGRCIGRIAREITGTTVGIALGGGGARGYAHIGTLKVLEEEGIPIDIVSGSSMGALIGAVYCMTGSAVETERILRKELAEYGSIFDFTLPVNAFLRGKHIRKISNTIFKDVSFSDMVIPFHVVCVDLISGQEVIISDGSVSRAVQASSAIPGIFPPIRWNDKYLVDGSVINKVPANILHKHNARRVISINVTPDRDTFMESRQKQHHGLAKWCRQIPFFRILLDEPSILQIITRSMNITNTQMSRAGSQYTDFEIKPCIEHFDFLNFKNFDPIVYAGENAAREKVENLKKLFF